MPIFWAIGGAALAGLGGSLISSNAATDAAKTQAASADKSTQFQEQVYNQTQQNLAPYLKSGQISLAQLQQLMGDPNSSINAPFTTANFQGSPGYQFQLGQGTQAILNNRSAVGGVNSGNTLKALTQYGQGLANQDYWNAYNQYTNNQNNIFNRLYSLSNQGQNAAVTQGGFGANLGTSVGNNITGAGNAIAAGQVGSANALAGGIGGVGNNFLLAQLLSGNQGSASGVDTTSLGGFANYIGGNPSINPNNIGYWDPGPQGFPVS